MPANNAFHQVKSLLGRMDRSIDEARHRRLGVPDETPEPRYQAGSNDLDQMIGSSQKDEAAPQSQPERKPSGLDEQTPPASPSKFGRAKPLRRPGEGTNGW